MTNLMKRFAIPLVSIYLISACAPIPDRPLGRECFPNLSSKDPINWYMLCFDFNEYDESGKLKPGAKGIRVPVTVEDIHGSSVFDATSRSNLHGYALKWKAYLGEKCK